MRLGCVLSLLAFLLVFCGYRACWLFPCLCAPEACASPHTDTTAAVPAYSCVELEVRGAGGTAMGCVFRE